MIELPEKGSLDLIERLFELSPHLLMVLCISFVLWALRRFRHPPTTFLPFLAMAIGAIVYPQIAEIGKVSYKVEFPQMILHMWGMALGALAFVFNGQFGKLVERFRPPTGNTECIVKEEEKL